MSQPEPLDENDGGDDRQSIEEAPEQSESDTGADPTSEGATDAEQTSEEQPAESNKQEENTHPAPDSPVEGTQYVAVENVAEQLERRIGDTGYQSKMANIIEELPDKYVERERRDEGHVIKLRTDGLSKVLNQNTGSAGSGGGDTHRYVLKRTYQTLTAAGFDIELPEQEGANQPDGIGELLVDLTSESYPEMRAKMETLKEEWPDAHHLSNGQNIYIEAETSTTSKPQQTLSNLQKAYDENRRCIFVFQDTYDPDDNSDLIQRARDAVRILTDPPAVAYQDTQSRRFYNQSDRMEVNEDHYAVRSRTETGERNSHTYWWERPDGTVALTDSSGPDGTAFAEFNSLQSVIDPDADEVPAYYTYDRAEKEYIVTDNQANGGANRTIYTDKEEFKHDWAKIYPPFIPENEFGNRLPTHEDWTCIIFPNDDKDVPPLEYIYNGRNGNGETETQLRPVLAKDRAEFDPTTLYDYVDDADAIPTEMGASASTGDENKNEQTSEERDGTTNENKTEEPQKQEDPSDETEDEDTDGTKQNGTDGGEVNNSESDESPDEGKSERDRITESESNEGEQQTQQQNTENRYTPGKDDGESGSSVTAEFQSEPSFEFDTSEFASSETVHEEGVKGEDNESNTTDESQTSQNNDQTSSSEEGKEESLDYGTWYLLDGLGESHILSPENEDLNRGGANHSGRHKTRTLCGQISHTTPEQIDNPFNHIEEVCSECGMLLQRRTGGSNEIGEVLEQYKEAANDEGDKRLNTPNSPPNPDDE